MQFVLVLKFVDRALDDEQGLMEARGWFCACQPHPSIDAVSLDGSPSAQDVGGCEQPGREFSAEASRILRGPSETGAVLAAIG